MDCTARCLRLSWSSTHPRESAQRRPLESGKLENELESDIPDLENQHRGSFFHSRYDLDWKAAVVSD